MYAVIKTGGKQYKVSEGDTISIEKLETEAGGSVTFEDVLMVNSEKATVVDAPGLAKASVKATVLEHYRDDKIKVFKYKSKKGYRKTQGHRQNLTKIKIESISG
jgi:large subunit ribosomal protein L21